MSLALSQRCRKNSLRQRLERPALRDEFRESWGEDMARDLELILVPIDILLVTQFFYHENNGIMTLMIIGYHWQQHFWTISKIAYIPIIFQALCGPWILDGSTALRDNDFGTFR